MSGGLDEVDRRILSLLGDDARNNTNAEISRRMDVSQSTVGNRIEDLQDEGVLTGYVPRIDYGRANYQLRMLLVCTASVRERADLVDAVAGLPGVVSVRELMTGRENVHVEVVGRDSEDVTRLAATLDELGLTVEEEVLVKSEHAEPANFVRDGWAGSRSAGPRNRDDSGA